MEHRDYKLTDNVVKNIITFLNRAELKGINESQAMMEIVGALQAPKEEIIEE